MNSVVANNDTNRERTDSRVQEGAPTQRGGTTRRGRGRPKGSKNKPKAGMFFATQDTHPQEYSDARKEGWEVVTTAITKKIGKPRSAATHRKWQREWVLPQFVLSRKQAQDLLVKFLRSKPGKPALSAIVSDGFIGIKKLPDVKLGEFLVTTNLLSRYPHQIVIRGG